MYNACSPQGSARTARFFEGPFPLVDPYYHKHDSGLWLKPYLIVEPSEDGELVVSFFAPGGIPAREGCSR